MPAHALSIWPLAKKGYTDPFEEREIEGRGSTLLSRIVAIEDDPGIAAVYHSLLGSIYDLTVVGDLEMALKLFSRDGLSCQLVITDLCLPDGSFNKVAQSSEWQEIVKRYPFLVISVIDDLDILDECLRVWASDYLVKPFNNNELLAKCKKLIASSQQPVLDVKKMVLVFDNQPSGELTAKEFKMLAHLLEQEGWQCHPSALLLAVWGEGVGMQRLHTGLSRLRAKLRPIGVEISPILNGNFALRAPGRP